MEQGKLTSINPLITHGNEFRGEIKVLNRARQVKTCIKVNHRVNLLDSLQYSLLNMNHKIKIDIMGSNELKDQKYVEVLHLLEEKLEYHCSIKLISHQREESECEKREKGWCCSPKEYTPRIQVLPRLIIWTKHYKFKIILAK